MLTITTIAIQPQEDRHREQPDETRDHRMGADMRVAHSVTSQLGHRMLCR
jgi:hypothetical protein